MKWILVLLGVVAIGVVGIAAPLSLCDYHAPQTSLSSLKLAMNYHYFDDPATPAADINSGRIAINYNQLFDSHDFGYTLFGTGTLDLANFTAAGGHGQGAGTFRYYLSDVHPIFGFGGINASYTIGQPSPAANVSIGTGYGRFSDVTPLAKAVKIEQDLLALKAISKPLPDNTVMALAKEIGKKAEYKTIKDLIAAIQPIIEKEAGVTLDARAILTIEDDIRATNDQVSCGWSIQAGLGYKLIDPTGGPQDLLVTISGDAAFAPQPGSQLTLHANLSGPFDIAANNTLTVNAAYDYALNKDVDLILNYQLQRVQPQGGQATDSQSITGSVAFNVGGADISLQVGFSKGATATGWSKDLTVSVGMNLL